MAPKLVGFIKDYRKTVGGLVFFINCTPWKKEYLAENINELYTDPKASFYSKDDSNFPDEFYQVKPLKQDIVLTKNHYDAFVNPKLDLILKRKGIQYLIVAGIFGDGCVLATICGGFSKGYNFVILKDLIETTDKEIRQRLLQNLKDFTWPIMYGRTMLSKDFLKAWEEK